MTYISMIGPGTVGETAEFLRSRLMQRCALAGEKRRGDTALLIFEKNSIFSRNVYLLTLDISISGGQVIVDAFSHASGTIFADDEELALAAAQLLCERGFAEYERESWTVSAASEAESARRETPETEYASPMDLARLGAPRGKGSDVTETAEPLRAKAAKPVKPEKRRRGKRSYDPEL